MSATGSRSTLLVAALVLVAAGLVGAGVAVLAGSGGDGDGNDGRDAEPTVPADGLVVEGAWTGPNQSVTAVYFAIRNGGDEDQLVAATTDIGGTALLMDPAADAGHTSAEGADAVALAIPLGTTELAPGGRHLMLTDLAESLDPGDELNLQLTFEHAGVVEVAVEVVSWEEVGERAG